MKAVKHIIIKELTRVFTDKKLVVSLFILPGVLIISMYTLMGRLMENMLTDIEQNVPKAYIQNAPENFNDFLTQIGYNADIEYLNSTDDIEPIKDEIFNGKVELLVVFDEGFSEVIHNYQVEGDPIPEVKTYYNSSVDYSLAARGNFISSVMMPYQQLYLSQRLGNMEQLLVFHIDIDPETSDIVDERKADSKALAMLLPFLINIMLFSGAMGLGVDSITGEKERGTLSSMLLSPIKRGEIVLGKLVSLAILSSISAVIYAVSVMIGINGLSGGELGGFNINFTIPEMLQLLITMMIVVYLYVALISLVAVYARTSKEANTYVMPFMVLVMLGSIFTMYTGTTERGIYQFAIPVYNSAISMQSLLTGELTFAQFGLMIGTTLLLAFLVTGLITKAFNSEKIMFNA